jgi:predicted DNA binding CopG/RHH family protein
MRRTIDADRPVGKMKRIKDFLPGPEELVYPEKKVKITISLSESSVTYFKNEAAKHRTKYQKMIRSLLDLYATQHSH